MPRKSTPDVRSTALAPRYGRPPIHFEPWSKVTCVMLDRHAGYIDFVSILIRLRHHKAMSRTEIIRALVEFMDRSGIDFSQFASMDEMVAFLTRQFRAAGRTTKLPLLLESGLFQPPAQES